MSRNLASYAGAPTPTQTVQNKPEVPRIRSTFRHRRNLLLDLPIGGRLTLGFILAALLATLVTGAIGLQRSQSLNRQSNFYKDLLTANTNLNTGANFLELMNTEMHVTLSDASVPHPSQETLTTDKKAVVGLESRYDALLKDYIAHNLVNRNSSEVALLNEANHGILAQQQVTLAGSALRAWNVYKSAQDQILGDITTGDPTVLANAQHLEQTQGEPTHVDAISSIHALVQHNNRLADSVGIADQIEVQQQLIITIISSILTFIGIIIVGWLISGTLVKRLRELRRVTQVVEQGKLEERVQVVGRDEIADVSASVNGMLEAIVGLIDETRSQRDALTNAAEHLFSDMRVVSAGDLRINAPVSNDPIGMLANAFNFTVGRFRRFVLRTQGNAEQIDSIARREIERTEHYLHTINKIMQSAQVERADKKTPSAALKHNNPSYKDPIQEMARVSTDFASDIAKWTHKLNAIVGELRQGTISFQLDAASNSGNALLSQSQPGWPFEDEMVQHEWSPVRQVSQPLNQGSVYTNRESVPNSSQSHSGDLWMRRQVSNSGEMQPMNPSQQGYNQRVTPPPVTPATNTPGIFRKKSLLSKVDEQQR